MLLLWLLALAQAAPAQPVPAGEAFKFDYFRQKDRVETDGSYQRTVEVSIQLKTPTAVQQFGQLAVPYVKDYGEVLFNSVRIHKPDGSSRAASDSRLEDLNPLGINDATIPVDFRIRKLTLSGLEPGDRLSYVIVHRMKPIVPGHVFDEIKFHALPLDGPQVYELDTPASSDLIVKVREGLNAAWEVLPGEPDRLNRRLAVRIPQLVVANTGLTEAQNRALQEPDVTVNTFKSWAEVGSWWWGIAQAQVRGDSQVAAEARRLVADRKTPREKVDALASFVASTVRYLNVGFGLGRMQPREAAVVLTSRYGDCKDKVGLLIALARAAGLDIRPVLISASRLELQDVSPGPNQFDHVIAVAMLGPDEKDWVWMDVTNALSSPMTLVAPLRDKRALLIDREGRGSIVRTPATPSRPARTAATMNATLDARGALKGRVKIETRSDLEPEFRSAFASVAVEQRAELLKTVLAHTWKEARITSVTTSDLANIALPFWVEFEFERDVTGIDSAKEWKLWVPDLGPVLLEATPDTTARKAVTFDVGETSLRASVELPGDVAARPPLSIAMARPFANLESKYAVTGRTLTVERLWRFPVPSIPREDLPAYDALRKAASTDREQDFTIGPVRTAAPAAATLQKEGKAAWTARDFPKSLQLLERARDADPKLSGINRDIGLVHRALDDHEKSVAAFTRAIEADPFTEVDYAERAYSLFELGRDTEAEKDLLKQIETAPFKDWSYRRLAQVRRHQKRFREAAELYGKALTIDPTPVGDWLELGLAHARDGREAEARTALAKAEQIGLSDGQRTSAAWGYSLADDLKAAEGLAQKDIPELLKRVEGITKENFFSRIYWSDQLVEAWEVLGRVAFAASDLKTAERYLRSAWECGLSPDAGLTLARVLAAQGKNAEASSVLAATVVMRPAIYQSKVVPPLLKRLGSEAVKANSETEFRRVAVVPITVSEAPKALSENVTVFVQGGRVVAAREFSKRRESDLAPLLKALVGQSVPWVAPDGEPATLVRDGFIDCPPDGCRFFVRIEREPKAR